MSSKKPVDHIEERIKLAAENSMPPFDEKAWQAMEAKLDGNNKRRRPLLWLFTLALITVGGIWGAYKFKNSSAGNDAPLISANAKTTDQQQHAGDQVAENTQPAPAGNAAGKSSQPATNGDAAVSKDAQDAGPDLNNSHNSEPATGSTNTNSNSTSSVNAKNVKDPEVKLPVKKNTTVASPGNKTTAGSFPGAKHKPLRKSSKGKMTSVVSGGDEEAPAADKNVTTAVTEAATTLPVEPVKTTPAEEQKNVTGADAATAVTQNTTVNKKDEPAGKTEAKKEKKEKKQTKGFYLLAIFGTDAGSTKLFSYSNSKITPRYGIGIGYQLNDRFSIQTGFYVTNKKYVAGKDDYAPKSTPNWQYLTRVKAACLIYEIPLTIRTELVRKPSFSVYGTIGASSYIMKREDYDYVYNYYGQEHTYPWRYTGNKHFLSVLSLSAGIEKKLPGRFSLLVEPSFGIPLKGVGDGRVKLYSSSLAAGLRYSFK